jgi:hypothetical protein
MSQTLKYRELPAKYELNLLQKVDRRSEVYKKLKRSYNAIVDDLGGKDELAHAKLMLVERLVFLEAVLETLEHQITTEPKASPKMLSRWIQGLNSLQGLAKTIGIERKPRKAGDLRAYVEGRRK